MESNTNPLQSLSPEVLAAIQQLIDQKVDEKLANFKLNTMNYW